MINQCTKNLGTQLNVSQPGSTRIALVLEIYKWVDLGSSQVCPGFNRVKGPDMGLPIYMIHGVKSAKGKRKKTYGYWQHLITIELFSGQQEPKPTMKKLLYSSIITI